jgi:uncharacterized membrane protein
MKLANAFALAMAVLWVLCSAVIWLLPSFSWTVTGWWMHGMGFVGYGRMELND